MDAPFSEDLVQQFRASLDTLLPLDQPLDWQVRADQPLCLHALQAISHYMNDPDRNLFPALIEGVSTGFQDNIAPSNVFAAKPPTEEPARLNCPSIGQTGRQQNLNRNSQKSWSKKNLRKDGLFASPAIWKRPNVNTRSALPWGNFQLPHRTKVHHD